MKLLFILMAALMLPVVPALACFPSEESETKDEKIAFQFGRDPIPMSFCESGEVGFVVVNGKCYDFDAITDFDTEEECQANAVCKAYREQQKDGTYHMNCSKVMRPMVGCGDDIVGTTPMPPSAESDPIDDPNHGEIKGDEELADNHFGDKDRLQDEEEHQEEEEQGQEESQEGGEISE